MKKIAALLTTAFVMTMSMATIFAAGSVSITPETVTDPTQVKVETSAIEQPEGSTLTVQSANVTAVTTVSQSDATKQAATAMKAVEEEGTVVKEAKIAGLVDINVVLTDANGNVVPVSETNPVDVKIELPSIVKSANQRIKVFNFHEGLGTWVECAVKGWESGWVKATFTHFSPVMVVTYEVEEQGNPGGGSTGSTGDTTDNGADTNTNSGSTTDTTVSPKTGVAFPMAAAIAGICFVGAAVCGKKVKFN